MVLVFYYKGMLEKVTMQRTQQFSEFSLLSKEPPKNPAKCSACVVNQKIATECNQSIYLTWSVRLAKKASSKVRHEKINRKKKL